MGEWEKIYAVRDTFIAAGLGVRASNCLIREGVFTFEQIASYSEEQLLRMPYLGRRTLEEIKFVLGTRGLRLAESEIEPYETALARILGKVHQTKAAYEAAQARLDRFLSARQAD
jgi:hypothetical protein